MLIDYRLNRGLLGRRSQEGYVTRYSLTCVLYFTVQYSTPQ